MVEDEEIARLEEQLATLSGQARMVPLLRLGQACRASWWRAGPGSAGSLGYLNKSIDAFTEACGYFDPNDPERFRTAVMLGSLHGARYGTHHNASDDGDIAIRLIQDSIGSPSIPPLQRAVAKMTLSQVYVGRTMRRLQSMEDFFTMARSGAPPGVGADMDRAAEYLGEVRADPVSPQITGAATSMLTIVDALRSFLGSAGIGGAGLDIGRLAEAMTKIQNMQRNGFGMNLPPTAMWDPEWATRNPFDRPAAHMTSNASTEEIQAPEPAAVLVDVDAVRAELGKLLGAEARDTVIEMLRADDPPEWLDEFVALATRVVDSAAPATGMDHFLLSAALHLRGRRDAGGWADGDSTGTDTDAAAESLITAADLVLAEDPDGLPALLFLATLLPDGTMRAIADRLTALPAIVRAVAADAVLFPAPADSLRFNVITRRIEPAGKGTVDKLVVIGDRPVADDPVVSYASSVAQLVDLSNRKSLPVTENPVFLANPRGGREWTTVETMLLRRTFYPRSRGFGRLVENIDGIGTPDEIKAALTDASLLQIGCGITAGGTLQLAGTAELDCSAITAGGALVILPPGHFLPLADTLLTAGCAGVIGWRLPLSNGAAALATFVLHTELVDHGRAPAAAVREVRRWFHRPDVAMLPTLLTRHADHLDADEAGWMSLVYQGR